MAAVRRGYEGSDAEELEEHLARFNMHVRARPLDGTRTMSSHSLLSGAPGVVSWDGEHRAGVVFTSDRRPDIFMVYAPVKGAMQGRVGGARHAAVPGRLLVERGVDLDEIRFDVGARHQGVSMDCSAVSDRLAVLLDRSPARELSFNPVTETGDAAAGVFMAVLAGLLQATLRRGLGPGSAAVEGIARALPSLLLECIPNNYSELLRAPPPKLMPRQVKRAISFMEEFPRHDLNIEELAKVSGVSVRSLQYAFRDFVGVSPGEYRRRQRAGHAAAEINRRDGRRPAQIAADWGFENITRFRLLCRKLQIEVMDF